jgi:hypothetical protein
MNGLSSRLAVVLAFFSLVLLVIVKEKFFKMVEKFMGGGASGKHGHNGKHGHKGLHGPSGTGAASGWDNYTYAPVYWYVTDYDMSKPCIKNTDCVTKRCTQFGFCAHA